MKVNIQQLDEIINSCEPNTDLNYLDVSKITNFGSLFWNSNFTGKINKWDVSNVTDMNHMFYNSKFNGDISKWNVNNVTNMDYMFENSKFTGDISKWHIPKIKELKGFQSSKMKLSLEMMLKI